MKLNTQQSLYECTRLMFEVASGRPIKQRGIEKNVLVYQQLKYFWITFIAGYNDKEHLEIRSRYRISSKKSTGT